MPREGWHYLVKKNATVFDTIGLIITFARKFPFQDSVTKAIRASHSSDKITFLRKLFDYVCRNTRYLKDTIGKEKIYTPDRSMREGHIGIDCKKYATFLGAALHRVGIKHYYKVISYDGSSYEHIYVIVPLKTDGYITLDPVNDCKFNQELQHKKAMLYDINGKPVELELHALGKKRNLGQPGTAAWEAFHNSRTWENYYRPGYGPVAGNGSVTEHGGADPSAERLRRMSTTEGFLPPRMRGGINSLNYDLDVLGALFKMGNTDLKKLGRTVPYLLLPIFAEQYNALAKAANKPTFVIPTDLKDKIALSRTWIVSKSRKAFHQTYWVYIGLGFSEAVGEPPLVAIDKMFKSKDIQLSGLGQEEGSVEWQAVKKIAKEAWNFIKSLVVTNIDKELEDYPESARFSVADWKRMFGVPLEPGGGPGEEPPPPQASHTGITAHLLYVAQNYTKTDEISFRTRGVVPVTPGETFTVEAPGYDGVYVALESFPIAGTVPGQRIITKGRVNTNSPTFRMVDTETGPIEYDDLNKGIVIDGVTSSQASPAGKTTQMLLPLGILSFFLLR